MEAIKLTIAFLLVVLGYVVLFGAAIVVPFLIQ